MRILVIGGTRFVGRHFVEAALARGHELTLLHRGRSGDDLFPTVKRIHANRDGGLDAIGDQTWDAVVDTCGYFPRVVEQSVRKLNGRAKTYLFISTVSVYSESNPHDRCVTEDDKVIRFDQVPENEEVTNESYGGFKVLCEETVRGGFEGRSIVLRPGLVIGPHDPSDRFTYWVDRFMRTDPVLVPEPLSGNMQFIDARDLATFALDRLEGSPDAEEVYNVVGPSLSYGETFEKIEQYTTGHPRRVSVPKSWLLEHEVRPWVDLPLWIPVNGPDGGVHSFDTSRALAAGLVTRVLAISIKDTAAWHQGRMTQPLKTGLPREREQEIIQQWTLGAVTR